MVVERTKPRRRKKRSSSAAKAVSVTARGSVGRKYPSNGKHPGREPAEHFHVNLAEIPFVTGKVHIAAVFSICYTDSCCHSLQFPLSWTVEFSAIHHLQYGMKCPLKFAIALPLLHLKGLLQHIISHVLFLSSTALSSPLATARASDPSLVTD